MEQALRKTVLVPTNPMHMATEVLSEFDQRHAFRIDMSTVTHDEVLEAAAAMAGSIKDLNAGRGDCAMSQRLERARGFIEPCHEIEKRE
jgi:hypothetical protein